VYIGPIENSVGRFLMRKFLNLLFADECINRFFLVLIFIVQTFGILQEQEQGEESG